MDASARERAGPPPSVWLVDGFNVLSAGLLGGRDRSGWWRRERREELLERVARFDDPEAELWVVFDGPRDPGTEAPQRPRAVFAPSADTWLLARVRTSEAPERLAVVTADRRLAARARRRGARVVAPGDFLARCPAAAGD